MPARFANNDSLMHQATPSMSHRSNDSSNNSGGGGSSDNITNIFKKQVSVQPSAAAGGGSGGGNFMFRLNFDLGEGKQAKVNVREGDNFYSLAH